MSKTLDNRGFKDSSIMKLNIILLLSQAVSYQNLNLVNVPPSQHVLQKVHFSQVNKIIQGL